MPDIHEESSHVADQPVGRPHFDGREMVMVHNMLRREFALLPGLVADVVAADHARAQMIGDHVEALISVVNHHHRSEDKHVWPVLVERSADSAHALTRAMEDQHELVDAQLHEVCLALRAWRVTVTADARQDLVDALAKLIPPLKRHLTDEEARVVPLMERYITAAEFIEIVRRGAANADLNESALGFGMVMYEGDPDIVDRSIAAMPPDVRSTIRQQAAQAFAEHSRRIHGTATPPRSTEVGAA
jgi:hemerythrin-like domain-containing protein